VIEFWSREGESWSYISFGQRLFCLVLSGNEETASHILYPISKEETPNGTVRYARPVLKRDGNTLVHWCNLPASYDSFVAADIAGNPTDFVSDHRKSWRVSLKAKQENFLHLSFCQCSLRRAENICQKHKVQKEKSLKSGHA